MPGMGGYTLFKSSKEFPRARGSTLVEMMVAVGIFFLVIGVIFSISGTSRMSWNIAHTRIFLQTQARNAITSITNDFIWASRALNPDIGAELSFKIPLVDPVTDGLDTWPGGDIKWGDGVNLNNYIDYRVINGNLVRQLLDFSKAPIAGSQRIIAQHVTNFNVTLNGNQYTITISFSMNNFWGALLPSPVIYPVTTGLTPRN